MKKKHTGIKVGDKVRFNMGVTPVIGTIIEDRGPIGIKGRQLYRIRFALEEPFFMEIEMPAVELEVVRDEAPAT